jgi:hypothetical protein
MGAKKKQSQKKGSQKPVDTIKDALAAKIGINTDDANSSGVASQEPTPTADLSQDKTHDFSHEEEKDGDKTSHKEEIKASSAHEEEKVSAMMSQNVTADSTVVSTESSFVDVKDQQEEERKRAEA